MIVTHDLPPDALLRKDREAGAYTDCYATDIAARVSHAAYAEAFCTTWVFKLERLLLKWFVSKPSTDDEARRLARGELAASPRGQWKPALPISCCSPTSSGEPSPG